MNSLYLLDQIVQPRLRCFGKIRRGCPSDGAGGDRSGSRSCHRSLGLRDFVDSGRDSAANIVQTLLDARNLLNQLIQLRIDRRHRAGRHFTVGSFAHPIHPFNHRLTDRIQAVREIAHLQYNLAKLVVGIEALHLDVLGIGPFDVSPAFCFLLGENFHQLAELEHIGFVVTGQRLRIVFIIADNQGLQFLVIHNRHHLLGDAVHIPVRPLQFERRLGTVLVSLGSTANVFPVYFQNHVAHRGQFFHRGHQFVQLFDRVVTFHFDSLTGILTGHLDDRVDILLAATGQFTEHRIRRQTVFQITHLKGVGRVTNNFTQVVDVGTVGEHVRNLELLAAFGIRVPGHHHDHFPTPQIVRSGLSLIDTLDLALRITERNKLLQQFRITVLNVIEVNHHVVAHLQREIQFLDFFTGTGVWRLRGIQRCDMMSNRRTVDFHEDNSQPIRDVLHQRGLTVSRRRYE